MWTMSASALELHRLRKVLADPRHRGGDASHGGLVLTHLGDARSDRTQKQANEYLVDDQWSEQLGFCGLRHRLDQARGRVGDRWRRPADDDGPTARRELRNAVRKHLQRQFGDPQRIELEHEGQERLALRWHARPGRRSAGRRRTRTCARRRRETTSLPSITIFAPCATTQNAGGTVPRTISRSGRERRTTQRPGRRSSKAPSYGELAASSVANR